MNAKAVRNLHGLNLIVRVHAVILVHKAQLVDLATGRAYNEIKRDIANDRFFRKTLVAIISNYPWFTGNRNISNNSNENIKRYKKLSLIHI